MQRNKSDVILGSTSASLSVPESKKEGSGPDDTKVLTGKQARLAQASAKQARMTVRHFFKFSGEFVQNLWKINLLFIFVFLNIWDFALSREVLNAMLIGLFMFGLSVLLWYIGSVRAAAANTLISLFEFMVMLVLVLQSFELGGFSISTKSVFWVPYLLMAGVNTFWGLKVYSERKYERGKENSGQTREVYSENREK